MTQGMVEVEESDFGGYTRPLDAHVLLAGESDVSTYEQNASYVVGSRFSPI